MVSRIFSQEVELSDETLSLLKNLLRLEIDVKLIHTEESKSVWSEKDTKYTIPGRAIKINVEGTNLKFFGYFTPYRLEGNKFLLFTQGQLWLEDAGDHEDDGTRGPLRAYGRVQGERGVSSDSGPGSSGPGGADKGSDRRAESRAR